ncbi:MAG: Dabb family protein [Spirochaetales bacterium]|nr:MAG: Dabb family protein [Spirochaetales bacterium]
MAEKVLAHNVFFKLKDGSEQAVGKLISDCNTYLKPIPGILYFSVGRLHTEHAREVNVRDFHVGIHVTFLNQAAHDFYQDCDLHNQFVDRNKDTWETVRVFDLSADYSG